MKTLSSEMLGQYIPLPPHKRPPTEPPDLNNPLKDGPEKSPLRKKKGPAENPLKETLKFYVI